MIQALISNQSIRSTYRNAFPWVLGYIRSLFVAPAVVIFAASICFSFVIFIIGLQIFGPSSTIAAPFVIVLLIFIAFEQLLSPLVGGDLNAFLLLWFIGGLIGQFIFLSLKNNYHVTFSLRRSIKTYILALSGWFLLLSILIYFQTLQKDRLTILGLILGLYLCILLSWLYITGMNKLFQAIFKRVRI